MNLIEESRNEPRRLAQANDALHLQVALLQKVPVAAWTVNPDGTPAFVNQSWLEYTGQTLKFVQSSPEAWMSAIHPEDREAAAKAFGREYDQARASQWNRDFAGPTTGHTAGISIEPYRYKMDKEKSSGLLAPQPTLRM